MNKIIIKDNFAFLYLNKSFYDKKSIIDTIEIYTEFFKAKTEETEKYFIIKIEKINNEFSIENLVNEFLNYLLSVQNSNIIGIKK